MGKIMQTRLLKGLFRIAAAMVLVNGLYLAAGSAQTMPVPSAGFVPDVPGATDKPDPTRAYKFAFDVQSMANSAGDVSPALTGIGRLLNTYRKFGVPANQLQATAVFHGRTIALVIKDDTYKARTGAPTNPNKTILKELLAAGVKLVVCGVSAREQNYVSSDFLPSVTTNLSATITFMELESRGYVKVER
jgi:intracellular sulfur oxidation DsrE/DsrF family protein